MMIFRSTLWVSSQPCLTIKQQKLVHRPQRQKCTEYVQSNSQKKMVPTLLCLRRISRGEARVGHLKFTASLTWLKSHIFWNSFQWILMVFSIVIMDYPRRLVHLGVLQQAETSLWPTCQEIWARNHVENMWKYGMVPREKILVRSGTRILWSAMFMLTICHHPRNNHDWAGSICTSEPWTTFPDDLRNPVRSLKKWWIMN
jgi:hypothetical protein